MIGHATQSSTVDRHGVVTRNLIRPSFGEKKMLKSSFRNEIEKLASFQRRPQIINYYK